MLSLTVFGFACRNNNSEIISRPVSCGGSLRVKMAYQVQQHSYEHMCTGTICDIDGEADSEFCSSVY
jgi:hypothetical protein